LAVEVHRNGDGWVGRKEVGDRRDAEGMERRRMHKDHGGS
jgi:hypothetical protein